MNARNANYRDFLIKLTLENGFQQVSTRIWKKGRTLFLSPMVPAAASCTRLRARCAFAVMGSWAHAGGWDGKFDSLDNFAVGRVASAERDSLTRRMLRPLDAGFSGASLFFFRAKAGYRACWRSSEGRSTRQPRI